MGASFYKGLNVAYISRMPTNNERERRRLRAEFKNLQEADLQSINPYAEIITDGSKTVQVLSYNVNSLKLKTSYSQEKFLVYYDSYHHQWKAAINGKDAVLWRVNVAFKGLRIPAGEQVITFTYQESWRYLMNFALIAIFMAVFCWLLYLGFQFRNLSLRAR